ncbi:MAG: type II secretion system GspH family protein [Candidatus Brocadia sp.]|nr:type II secretion system GspH family protein [Candidatus Brocadia sp.]NUO08586.1 type II secretion system protein [Candidatus Brocadia sp.]
MKLRNTNVENKNSFAPGERKPLHVWRGERNNTFDCCLKPRPTFLTGFTILEVMVALAIMGISIGIFFGLIGNSSRLRGKLDEHTKLLLLARTKMEEAFLGILGRKYTKVNERKTFEGTTKGGIQWKVSEVDKYKEATDKIRLNTKGIDESDTEVPPKGTMLLSTFVGGISIETIIFSQEFEGKSEEKDSDESEKVSD